MGWSDWIAGASTFEAQQFTPEFTSDYRPSNAFLQPLPDGSYSRFAPTTGRSGWFPTDPIITDVGAVLGSHAAPPTLSFSEQLFTFEPWPGYIGVSANAAASTQDWFSRLSALRTLADIANPAAFARASAHTSYGGIDVFVLQAQGPYWQWSAGNYPATVRFTPAQFTSPAFAVFRDLPNGIKVVVRRSDPTR